MGYGTRSVFCIVGGLILAVSPFLTWMQNLMDSAVGLTTAWGIGTGVVGGVVLVLGLTGRFGTKAGWTTFGAGILGALFPIMQWAYLYGANPGVGLYIALVTGIGLILVGGSEVFEVDTSGS